VNLDREKFLALTIALSSGPLGACAPASTTSTTPAPNSDPATTPPPSEPPPSVPPPATAPPTAQNDPNPCTSWAPWGECVAHGNEEPPFFECQQDDPSVEGCKSWKSDRPHNGCSLFDASGKCIG